MEEVKLKKSGPKYSKTLFCHGKCVNNIHICIFQLYLEHGTPKDPFIDLFFFNIAAKDTPAGQQECSC